MVFIVWDIFPFVLNDVVSLIFLCFPFGIPVSAPGALRADWDGCGLGLVRLVLSTRRLGEEAVQKLLHKRSVSGKLLHSKGNEKNDRHERMDRQAVRVLQTP